MSTITITTTDTGDTVAHMRGVGALTCLCAPLTATDATLTVFGVDVDGPAHARRVSPRIFVLPLHLAHTAQGYHRDGTPVRYTATGAPIPEPVFTHDPVYAHTWTITHLEPLTGAPWAYIRDAAAVHAPITTPTQAGF